MHNAQTIALQRDSEVAVSLATGDSLDRGAQARPEELLASFQLPQNQHRLFSSRNEIGSFVIKQSNDVNYQCSLIQVIIDHEVLNAKPLQFSLSLLSLLSTPLFPFPSPCVLERRMEIERGRGN